MLKPRISWPELDIYGGSSQYCLTVYRERGGGKTLDVDCHCKYDSGASFANCECVFVVVVWRPLNWSVLCGPCLGKHLTSELSFFVCFVLYHYNISETFSLHLMTVEHTLCYIWYILKCLSGKLGMLFLDVFDQSFLFAYILKIFCF